MVKARKNERFMYLALVYFPKVKHEGFHAFRYRHEPYAGLLPEHMTFVFPVGESIGRQALEQHILEVLAPWSPFRMHFCRLMKSPDHWLFWIAEEGKDGAMRLHDELYTGILARHLRKDLPYTPHIGVGLFSREDYDMENPTAALTLDEDRYQQARKEFTEMSLDLWCTVDQLALLGINDDFTECKRLHTFHL